MKQAQQEVILRTIGLLRTANGAWVLCRVRSESMRRWIPSEGARRTQRLIEGLLGFWRRDGVRMVPVYSEPKKFESCTEGGKPLACLAGRP